LMTLAGHALDNFFRDRWIVFAALEALIKQLDPEIRYFLPGSFRNLFFDLAAAELNIRDVAWQNRAAFLQLLVAHRLATFRHANDLDQIMCRDGGARFTA